MGTEDYEQFVEIEEDLTTANEAQSTVEVGEERLGRITSVERCTPSEVPTAWLQWNASELLDEELDGLSIGQLREAASAIPSLLPDELIHLTIRSGADEFDAYYPTGELEDGALPEQATTYPVDRLSDLAEARVPVRVIDESGLVTLAELPTKWSEGHSKRPELWEGLQAGNIDYDGEAYRPTGELQRVHAMQGFLLGFGINASFFLLIFSVLAFSMIGIYAALFISFLLPFMSDALPYYLFGTPAGARYPLLDLFR